MKLFVCTVVTLVVAISTRVQCQQDPDNTNTADTSAIEGLFNCNRGNMACMGDNSTCVEATGTCNCEVGFEWFDCSIETDKKVTENCDCLHSGVCVEEGSGTMCVCSDPYFGPKCAMERVTAECFHDSMEISIFPYGDVFDGVIYVLDNETPECTLPDNGNGMFQKKLKYSDCGAAEVANETNGDTVKSFIVVVQYDSLFLNVYDQEFEFSCTIRKSDSTLEWETTDLESNKNQRNLQQQKVSKEVKPVTLTLRHAKTGEVITTPQSIGTPVKMCFNLNGGEEYDSFRVEQVTAHNGLTGARAKNFDFVTGACVNPLAGSVGSGKKIVTDFSGDPSSEVCLKFKLIKLPYSNQLAFKNVVKICKGTGSCNTTICDPNEFMKLGRKRRSIEDFQIDEENSDDTESTFKEVDDQGIVVWIPGQKLTQEQAQDYMNDVNKNSNNQPGFCFHNIWVIVCIVALLLVFSLGGALVAVLCLRRRGGKESAVLEGFDNKAYNTKI